MNTGFDIRAGSLHGLWLMHYPLHHDQRGYLAKPIREQALQEAGLSVCAAESFFSVSHRGVLRGMHLSQAPHDSAKQVYVVAGEVLDVVLDVRPQSPSYGQVFSQVLSATTGLALHLESGLAHGFLVLSDSATVAYQMSRSHSPAHDSGIRWDSFGFVWPESQPVISPRDQQLPSWPEFVWAGD